MRPILAENLESLKSAVRTNAFYYENLGVQEAAIRKYSISEEDLMEVAAERVGEIKFNLFLANAELKCAREMVDCVDDSMNVLTEVCGDDVADICWDMYEEGKSLANKAKELCYSKRQMERLHSQWNHKYSEEVKKRRSASGRKTEKIQSCSAFCA